MNLRHSISKSSQLGAGTILTYLQLITGTLFSLVITPYILKSIGQSEYGLYSTVSSTISMLSILSLGFGSSYIRYFTQFRFDKERLARLNGLFLLVFCVIGVLALIIGLVISFNQKLIFADGLKAEELPLARTLMIMLTLNISVGFPCSVFTSIITAHERFIFAKTLALFRSVATPVVTVIVLALGANSIGIVAVTLGVALIIDICNIVYAMKRLHTRFAFRGLDVSLLKDLFVYTFFIAINMLINQVNMNIPKVILTRYRGTSEAAVFALAQVIYTHYSPISTAISNVFTPRIHHIVTQNADDEAQQNKLLSELFIRIGRIQYIILSIIVTGFVLVGEAFVRRWAGNANMDVYWITLMLIVPAIIPLSQNLGIEIQRAKNMHRFRALAYLAMAAVNVILCVILVQKVGAKGAATGTSISLVLANGVLMNWYYKKKIGLDIKGYWKSIFRITMGIITPMLIFLFANRYIRVAGYMEIIIYVCIYVLLALISLWFISFNAFEKQQFLRFCRRFLRLSKKH